MDQFSHDPFENATDEDLAHHRNDSRDSLFLMADARIAGHPEINQVRVRNLSTGGLMAEFPGGLEQGTRVEIDVRGVGWCPGRIAWSAAGRVGVAFDAAIDPMLARKPVGQGAKTPTYVKPIFTRR